MDSISGIKSVQNAMNWFSFGKDELGVSEEVLQFYLAHGDSVLLVTLIPPLLVRCQWIRLGSHNTVDHKQTPFIGSCPLCQLPSEGSVFKISLPYDLPTMNMSSLPDISTFGS
jgi:hypothetical protein